MAISLLCFVTIFKLAYVTHFWVIFGNLKYYLNKLFFSQCIYKTKGKTVYPELYFLSVRLSHHHIGDKSRSRKICGSIHTRHQMTQYFYFFFILYRKPLSTVIVFGKI